MREFVSRTSTGVRGISLQRRRRGHLDVDPEAFDAPRRRSARITCGAAPWKAEPGATRSLSETRAGQFADAEQFILTVTSNGFGKRSSAFEYRQSGRGGQGIANIADSERNGTGRRQLPGARCRRS